MNYQEFLSEKQSFGCDCGFEPIWIPDFLFGFQKHLVEWAIHRGRAAIFADCGLGKTPMQLVWAENVVRRTGKPVLIFTPLAVAPQHIREAHKFDIDAEHSRDGSIHSPIVVTNYQRLHYFDRDKFGGVVCDESGILKNYDGATREAVTDFMRRIPYRLLCTATPSPNDYIELGTSSEAIGELGFMDMLNRFFKQASGVWVRAFQREQAIEGLAVGGFGKYRFRGHAQHDFWRWVCSWARAVRMPSDLGFENDGYILPPLRTVEHIVKAIIPRDDMLFDLPAITLEEQRAERRRTIKERCEQAAALVNDSGKPAVVWCHLNEEGHLLEKMIPDAIEVDGSDPDEFKEETFEAFVTGKVRVLVSKPVIAGFGLNWEHCAHQTFFPSHSFEQWYQAIRRCWRFGQKHPVRIDVIASEGEAGVLANLHRKSLAAEEMFMKLVKLINQELRIEQKNLFTKREEIPAWL